MGHVHPTPPASAQLRATNPLTSEAYRALRANKEAKVGVQQLEAQAWYESKVKRDGGGKARAVVGLMRKLVKALYHVARGEPFDSRKLFDVRRLKLAQS